MLNKNAILFLGLSLALLACSDAKKQQKPEMGKGMNAPQIANYIVLRDTSIKEVIQITGTIQAEESVDLRPEMSGKVVKIIFKEGSSVKQGDLLVKINDEELKAQYNRAVSRLKLAEEQEYRQRVLLKKEAISQQEYDIVNTELQSMKSESELLKAQLAKTEIRAPFNGHLGLRMISVGDFISSSSVVTKIVKDDQVKITFSIPEKYASHMKSNAEIVFSTDGNSKQYKALVYAKDPSIDENTRTLSVRAIAKNDGMLTPGSFCKVILEMNEIKNTILIPNESIIPILKGKKVFIAKNNTASEVIIKTGIRTAKLVQITDGLHAGDTLITSGIMSIKDGSSLKLK
jgi:membrane fusion protein (multidrug efflux system)